MFAVHWVMTFQASGTQVGSGGSNAGLCADARAQNRSTKAHKTSRTITRRAIRESNLWPKRSKTIDITGTYASFAKHAPKLNHLEFEGIPSPPALEAHHGQPPGLNFSGAIHLRCVCRLERRRRADP